MRGRAVDQSTRPLSAAREIDEDGGTYVLVDDGPPERWRYDFVVIEL